MATTVPVTIVIVVVKGRIFTIDSILVLWWNWNRAMTISTLSRAVVATVSVACIMVVVKMGAEVVSVFIGSVLSWNWTIAVTVSVPAVPGVMVVVEMGASRSVLVVIISGGTGAGVGMVTCVGRTVTRVAGRRIVILVRSASTSTTLSIY